MKNKYPKLWKWTKIILVVYILGGVALYFLQDYILFRPVPLKKDYNYNFPEKHKEINIHFELLTLKMVIFILF